MKSFVTFIILCACWYTNSFAQGSWNQTTTTDFSADSNFNVSTNNDELKLTNDVGTGMDGNLYVPPAGTVKTDSAKTYVTGNNPSGQNALRVYTTAGFAVGNEVLIITMQDSNADLNNNITAQYEFRRVFRTLPETLYFTQNLKNTYNSSGKKHQVIRVPNYDAITIDGGGVLTCDDWDGTTGGIIAFRARGLVNIVAEGKIDATAKGYLGGTSVTGVFARGIQGEGILRVGTTGYTNNLDGGGGGYVGNYYQLAGGGGGGYGDSGQAGQVSGNMSYAGQPGIPVGNVFLGKFFLGGGAGSGATDGYVSATAGKGGDGGGMVYISADSISMIGYCLANGQSGDNYSSGPRAGGGGGGSGGTIYLMAHKALNLGNNFVSAIGGSGGLGTDPGSNNGGSGGNGRIRIDAPSTIGTTNPAVGYNGVSYAYLGTSITPLITKPSNQFWNNLTFNKNTSAPGTSIVVDVLNSSDSVLLSNVPSGTNINLAGVDSAIHTIKLLARLINTAGNQTPILYDWTIRWDSIATGVKEISSAIPNSYSLAQNYPNPFNPITKIQFGIPKTSSVKILVYDVLGREVATLVNQEFKPGNYETQWDATSFASGMYYCRFSSTDFVQVRKLLLLK